ncbi:MAG: DoxX family protein [Sulfurovum sp.]|nr:MAG: DoxX family protein [Sulfurovum sp.]
MRDFIGELRVLLSYPKNILLLAARIVVAYGFALPAMVKINDLSSTAKWFEKLHIPFSYISAYLVSTIETIGLVLLVFGLFTRFVSLLLSCVMIGAIYFVHWRHGFNAADNGFEIPLYYLLFLLILATYGAGKYSLDHLLFKDSIYE